MAAGVTSNAMGEPAFVAPGAWPDDIEFDPVESQRGTDGCRHIERDRTVRCRRREAGGIGVDTRRHDAEIGGSELVAARMDDRTDDGSRDPPTVTCGGVDGDVDHTGRQTAPTGVCSDDGGVVGDQHQRRAVGRPDRRIHPGPTGDHHIADIPRHVRIQIEQVQIDQVQIDQGEAVDLVEHRPSATGHSDLAGFESGGDDVAGMEVAVGSLRRNDLDDAVGQRRAVQRDRQVSASLEE